jgi:hypothetical protein
MLFGGGIGNVMSMYTQLLGAAYGQRHPGGARPSEDVAVAQVRWCRVELESGRPPGLDPDAVPVILALEIGYDVALLELAGVMGIETEPARFEQPRIERDRLERALRARGVAVEETAQETAGSDRY